MRTFAIATSLLAGLSLSPAWAVEELGPTVKGASYVDEGAIFYVPGQPLPGGTGVMQSFLRTQGTGETSGYNTDGKLEFETKPGPFTHSILAVDTLAHNSITINGVVYVEFLLDINQTDKQPILHLEDLEFWMTWQPGITDYASFSLAAQAAKVGVFGTSTGSQIAPFNRVTGSIDGLTGQPGITGYASSSFAAQATKVWDLDATDDTTIKIDYSHFSGSGDPDLVVLIPRSVFDTSMGSHIVLFNRFTNNNDGFEEWALRTPRTYTADYCQAFGLLDPNCEGVIVPLQVSEPGTLALAGLGLLGAALSMRGVRRRRQAA